MTGNAGMDTFRDGSLAGSGDIDVLVENQDLDMGLFGDIFITGTLLGDTGATPFSQATGRADATRGRPELPLAGRRRPLASAARPSRTSAGCSSAPS